MGTPKKYEVRKFTIRYTKYFSKEKWQQRKNLEKQLKRNLDEDNVSKYNSIKNELDVIYNHITEDIQIKSKCYWYEHGKKLTFFFFLNLEKQQDLKIQ